MGGMKVIVDASGTYYLSTKSGFPFALGRLFWGESRSRKKEKEKKSPTEKSSERGSRPGNPEFENLSRTRRFARAAASWNSFLPAIDRERVRGA